MQWENDFTSCYSVQQMRNNAEIPMERSPHLTFCCMNTNLLFGSSVASGVTSLPKIPDKCTKVHHFVEWIIRFKISENIGNLTSIQYIHLQYELKSFCHCISTLNIRFPLLFATKHCGILLHCSTHTIGLTGQLFSCIRPGAVAFCEFLLSSA